MDIYRNWKTTVFTIVVKQEGRGIAIYESVILDPENNIIEITIQYLKTSHSPFTTHFTM
ncbi:MAG: hypothetical protein ACXVLT_14835 [Flavisolibacter sp.]